MTTQITICLQKQPARLFNLPLSEKKILELCVFEKHMTTRCRRMMTTRESGSCCGNDSVVVTTR